MSLTAERILEDALQLADRDRADLAGRLIESLDAGEDDDAEEAWDLEIARRIEKLEEGTTKPIAWHVARQTISGERDG